jgi:hypothetical protein
MLIPSSHTLAAVAPLLAVAGHHGGRKFLWIVGWLAILAGLVALAVWLVRRRRPRAQGRG